jgi:hypothetical protein
MGGLPLPRLEFLNLRRYPDLDLKGLSIADLCTIRAEVILPGYVQTTTLVPSSPDAPFSTPFTAIKVYLPSGSSASLRKAYLDTMLTHFEPTPEYTFMGKDFN